MRGVERRGSESNESFKQSKQSYHMVTTRQIRHPHIDIRPKMSLKIRPKNWHENSQNTLPEYSGITVNTRGILSKTIP